MLCIRTPVPNAMAFQHGPGTLSLASSMNEMDDSHRSESDVILTI